MKSLKKLLIGIALVSLSIVGCSLNPTSQQSDNNETNISDLINSSNNDESSKNNKSHGSENASNSSKQNTSSASSSSSVSHVHSAGTPVQENVHAATCTEQGSYDLVTYCSECHQEISREHKTSNALGHDLVHHDGKDATCTEAGWNAYDTCSRCDYTTYRDIPATGHKNTATREENRIEATCTEDGSYDLVTYCIDDNVVLSTEHKTIRALGHSLVQHRAKTATCTEAGWNAYVTCSRCDYTTYQEIPAGHKWGETSYTWSEDYLTCTAERTCLRENWQKENEIGSSIIEVITPPTKENEGLAKYTVTFQNPDFEVQSKDVVLEKLYYGETPKLSEDEKTITYGLYPKTLINNTYIIEALNTITTPESNGYYFYNYNYYTRVNAIPYNSSQCFEDGATITDGATYWFRCEPITWNIMSNEGGSYFVVSNSLLDSLRYNKNDGSYPNDYSGSEIKRWLNNDFYNAAFALGDSYVQSTVVDNSASTTDSQSNKYNFSNTEDKVFLPSYQDYKNSNYGFSIGNTRTCKTTDWARARGAIYDSYSERSGNGYYWIRSPYYYSGNAYAWAINNEGTFSYGSVDDTFRCARPSIVISNPYYGETPMLSEDGSTITYGLYPQRHVSDSSLKQALNALTTPESNGWYLYRNDYYAKLVATPFVSNLKFDDGATIAKGGTYWFKCEPITWNVLSNNDGEYYAISSVLLDAHRYNSSWQETDENGRYANNYEYSEIRAWLNDDFYSAAFALDNRHIKTSSVDNGASTTDSSSNPYVCNNTQDNVFLPTYQDYLNEKYGFSTSNNNTETRCSKTTDWARARGANYNENPSSDTYSYYQYGSGTYWTRSPCGLDSNSYSAWAVGQTGRIDCYNVDGKKMSVRPGVLIKID